MELRPEDCNFISQGVYDFFGLVICEGLGVGFDHGGGSPSVVELNFCSPGGRESGEYLSLQEKFRLTPVEYFGMLRPK